MTALLEVRNLTAGYGRARILDGLDLDVAEREIVTVIGPNGAGKTTLLSAIMGLLPRRGDVRLSGTAIRPGDVEAMVRARVALVPEHRELFTEMSVADNLLLGRYPSHLRREKPADFDTIYTLFPRLAERRRQLAGTLSGGERQMLALARGLMGRPRLLMLDEPSLGLAPRIVADVLRTIAALPAQGVAVLIVEQNARAVLDIADRGYVLELGAVTLAGPAKALAQDPRIVETYLGRGR
jgi:branched-chain amino acid transport system ATP-binding protein